MEGQRIGSYRVLRKIGEGGMGAVYEAVHEQIGRKAAIKVLHAELSQREENAVRFFNEARAVNIIQHPGIVNTYEFGRQPDGTAYIVMEYLEGESLSRRIQRLGKNLGPDALRLARQIASGLTAAHAKGIVHRDLKPDNVMIVADVEAAGGERAKLLDFGIAKITDDPPGGQGKTSSNVLMGTPKYMSPEQCRGAGGVDDKTDVYALGCILYEMLTGGPPFTATGMGEIMAMHLYREATPLRELQPAVSEGLAGLIHAMLAKAPQQRPTMAGVAQALEGLGAPRATHSQHVITAAGQQIGTPSTLGQSVGQRGPIAVTRRTLFLGGGALAGLIIAGCAGLLLVQDHRGGAGAAQVMRPPQGRVRWSVVSFPLGALVISAEDQKILGTTPWQREQPAATGRLTVVLRHEGFVDRTIGLDLATSVSLHEKMDRVQKVVEEVQQAAAAQQAGDGAGEDQAASRPESQATGKPAGKATGKPAKAKATRKKPRRETSNDDVDALK